MAEFPLHIGEENAAAAPYGLCEGYFKDSHGVMRPCLVRNDPWPIDSFVNFALPQRRVHLAEEEADPEEEMQLAEIWGEEDHVVPEAMVLSSMKQVMGLNDCQLLTENESPGAGSDPVQMAIERCSEKFKFYREPDANGNCELVDYNPRLRPHLVRSTVLIGNFTRTFIHDALEGAGHAELHMTRVCKRNPGLESANGEEQARRQTDARLKIAKEPKKQSKHLKGKKKARNVTAAIKAHPRQDSSLGGPLSENLMHQLELQARLEKDIIYATLGHPCYAYVNCWAAMVPTVEGDHQFRKPEGIPESYILSDDGAAGCNLENEENAMQHPLPVSEVQDSAYATNRLPAAWNANADIPSVDVNVGAERTNVQTGMMRLQIPDPIISGYAHSRGGGNDLVANLNLAAFDLRIDGILESNVGRDRIRIQPRPRPRVRMNSVAATDSAANGVVERGPAPRRIRENILASSRLQVQQPRPARVELEGVRDERNGLPVETQAEDRLLHGGVRPNVDTDGAGTSSYVHPRVLRPGLPPLPNRRPLAKAVAPPRVRVLRKPRSLRPRKRLLRNLLGNL